MLHLITVTEKIRTFKFKILTFHNIKILNIKKCTYLFCNSNNNETKNKTKTIQWCAHIASITVLPAGRRRCFVRIVGPFSGWSLGHVFIFHASFMGGGWSKFEVIRGGSRNGALWRETCWMDPVVLDGRETKSFGRLWWRFGTDPALRGQHSL